MKKIRFQIVLTLEERKRYREAQKKAGYRSLGSFIRRACNKYSREVLK